MHHSKTDYEIEYIRLFANAVNAGGDVHMLKHTVNVDGCITCGHCISNMTLISYSEYAILYNTGIMRPRIDKDVSYKVF